MKMFGLWVWVACSSQPTPAVHISDCLEYDCRQAWVLEQFPVDPSAVSGWIAGVEDPVEQHALVSLVGERWPGELTVLCQALSPGDALKRCRAIESRPHLWEPDSKQVPPQPSAMPASITGPFSQVSVDASGSCQDSIAQHACLQDQALRNVQAVSASSAAALCKRIEDGVWQEECFFRVAERMILAGDQAYGDAMGLCLEAGQFESNCRDHVRNTLTWQVPPVDAGNLYSWQERGRRFDETIAKLSQQSPEFGRYITEVYWAEVMEKAYSSTGEVVGFPVEVLPVAAWPHVRAAAAARALALEPSSSRTLAEWVATLESALARTRTFEDITMSEGARAPKRVVDLWGGSTPDVDTTVVYLSGSRRMVSENVQTDLAVCLLEAAARTDPVLRALLEEGLVHPSPLVQQTAQRLR